MSKARDVYWRCGTFRAEPELLLPSGRIECLLLGRVFTFRLPADIAISLAHWILDTFAESESAAKPGAPGAPRSEEA